MNSCPPCEILLSLTIIIILHFNNIASNKKWAKCENQSVLTDQAGMLLTGNERWWQDKSDLAMSYCQSNAAEFTKNTSQLWICWHYQMHTTLQWTHQIGFQHIAFGRKTQNTLRISDISFIPPSSMHSKITDKRTGKTNCTQNYKRMYTQQVYKLPRTSLNFAVFTTSHCVLQQWSGLKYNNNRWKLKHLARIYTDSFNTGFIWFYKLNKQNIR